MPGVQKEKTGAVAFRSQPDKVEDYVKEPAKQFSDSDALKKLAEQSASKSDGKWSADDAKYQIAVEAAQDRLADVGDVDDAFLKQTIDDIYENELDAETTGKAHRGEDNWISAAIGGMKDLIDNGNKQIGTWIDDAWDWGIGGIADATMGKGMGDLARNAFDGDALAIVPDILTDVALSAIPVAGIPLVVAKNAIQQSDNIAEALTGKDNITKRDLGEWERLGKGATALGSTALSIVPGIGKARGIAKVNEVGGAASNEIKEAAAKYGMSEDDLLKIIEERSLTQPSDTTVTALAKVPESSSLQNLQGTSSAISDDVIESLKGSAQVISDLKKTPYTQRVKEGFESFKKNLDTDPNVDRAALKKEKNAAKERYQNIKEEHGKKSKETSEALDELNDLRTELFESGIHPIRAITDLKRGITPRSQASEVFSAMKPYLGSTERAKDQVTSRLASLGWSAGLTVPMMAASEMAETGANPLESIINTTSRIATPGAGPNLLTTMFPLGARGFARSKLSPKMKSKNMGGPNFPAVRAGAYGDYVSRVGQRDIDDNSLNEQSISDALARYLEQGEE